MLLRMTINSVFIPVHPALAYLYVEDSIAVNKWKHS